MKLARDIMSLSTFKRDSSKVMKQLNKTKQPVVLTVNGKAAMVVHDVEGFEDCMAVRNRAETVERIRLGLKSMEEGRGIPAEEFFEKFFKEKGIPFESL